MACSNFTPNDNERNCAACNADITEHVHAADASIFMGGHSVAVENAAFPHVQTIGEYLDTKGYVNISDPYGIASERFSEVSEPSHRVICGDNEVRIFFYQDNKAMRFTPALVVDRNADYRLVWSS